MIVYHNPLHAGHAPAFEFFRGERVPCFESPGRAAYVLAALAARGHDLRLPDADAAPWLARVHAPRYLRFLETAWEQWLARDPSNEGVQPFPSVWPVRTLRSDAEPLDFVARLGLYSMDNGTPMVAGTWAAARQAADAAASAAGRVAAGARFAMSAARPPGHHAGPDFMGGYCFLNHAAVAAERLREAGCARVAVLDVDYHHGNGTQAIFEARADVLVVNVHGDPRTEYPFYLGHADERGHGAGEGYTLNLPLPAGASRAAWFEALEAACARVRRHDPQALVVSLGLDTFAEDPISRFALLADDFVRLGERLARLALPTVLILEGGYATEALGENTARVLEGCEAG